MTLTVIDFFCGAGGSSQGAAAVPGTQIVLAANHWDQAIASHAANFPRTDHYRGHIHAADAARFPAADLFWASPECPQWSAARGTRRDFDRQPDLFGEVLPDPATDRSRALMWDVPRYLEATAARGRPVLAGVVENVTEVRQWARWGEWVDAPAQVAEWAGHSVAILLKIYAKCIDGQDDIAKRRIEEALGDPGEDASEPGQPDSDDRQD